MRGVIGVAAAAGLVVAPAAIPAAATQLRGTAGPGFSITLQSDAGALVSPELTRQMKEVLSRPGIHHKFVKGLEHVPGVTLFRKSGTWKDFHSDSALVEAGGHKYVMVGIAHDAKGGEWLERLAQPLHEIVVGPSLVAQR